MAQPTILYDRKRHKDLPYPMSPYRQWQDDEGFGFEVDAPRYAECDRCGSWGKIIAERLVEQRRDPTVVFLLDACGHWNL